MDSSYTADGRRYYHKADFSGEVVLIMDEIEVEKEEGENRVAVLISVQDLLDIADAARAATEDPNYDADHR